MTDSSERAVAAATTAIRDRLGPDFPQIAMVLGSGLGPVSEALQNIRKMPYTDIPGFPVPSVPGHAGMLMTGMLADVPVALMCGRVHAYEGLPSGAFTTPLRTLHALGVETLILTSAVGGIAGAAQPGRVMLVSDHINLSGWSPLTGETGEGFGPRFVDMTQAYDRDLQDQLTIAAQAAGTDLPRGVYLFTRGPSFETPAEVRMFASLGADMAGMSMVPECLVARQVGMRVAGLAVVTNRAAGLSESALSHEGTLAAAQKGAVILRQIFMHFLQRFCVSTRN